MPNKKSCVDSYKNNCKEMECRGKTGEDKGSCETICNSISL